MGLTPANGDKVACPNYLGSQSSCGVASSQTGSCTLSDYRLMYGIGPDKRTGAASASQTCAEYCVQDQYVQKMKDGGAKEGACCDGSHCRFDSCYDGQYGAFRVCDSGTA